MEDDNELIVSYSWTSLCVCFVFVSTCVYTLYYVLCMIVTDTL